MNGDKAIGIAQGVCLKLGLFPVGVTGYPSGDAHTIAEAIVQACADEQLQAAVQFFGESALGQPLHFAVGDQVEKYTGDYHAKGEVRGIFAMNNGAIRYVVEHLAEGGGSFCHIYSEKNLRKVEQ